MFSYHFQTIRFFMFSSYLQFQHTKNWESFVRSLVKSLKLRRLWLKYFCYENKIWLSNRWCVCQQQFYYFKSFKVVRSNFKSKSKMSRKPANVEIQRLYTERKQLKDEEKIIIDILVRNFVLWFEKFEQISEYFL